MQQQATAGNRASIAVVDNATQTDWSQHRVLTTMEETGPLLGLAYDPGRQIVYAAGYFKLNVPYTTGGADQLFSVDLTTGDVVRQLGLPAGASVPDGTFQSMGLVGRTGLGDIDYDPATDTIFVANLYDRRVYRIDAGSGAILGSFGHGAAGEPWSADAYVFGVGVRDGQVYHGVVDTKERMAGESPVGHVYRSSEDGSGMTEVAQWRFDYERQTPWQSWRDPSEQNPGASYGQPMVSDIEFTAAGDLLIGVRDRAVDMLASHYTDVDRTGRRWPQGDVLASSRAGDGWTVLTGQRNPIDVSTDHYRTAAQGMLSSPHTGTTAVVALGVARNSPLPNDLASGLLFINGATGEQSGQAAVTACGLRECGVDSMGDVERLTCLSPSPSPEVPTASPTPSPTSQPTLATATNWPSATPTSTTVPTTARIFLPNSVMRYCIRSKPIDVALVIDTSSSMLESGGATSSKLDEAVKAVKGFLSHLLDRDQAALVWFNETAGVAVPLTSERNTIVEALDQLEAKEYTRLDLGIAAAREELLGERHRPGNTRIMIVLTDGRSNPVPVAMAEGEADRAKDEGIVIFTVGLGRESDLDHEALGRIASRLQYYYVTPDMSDLSRIYSEIAALSSCLDR